MTEEKKKPEEDEVTDQQLDDVAGGMFPASTSGDGSGAALCYPDVCKTPILGVPEPTPFPNIALTDDTDTTTKTKTTTKGDTTEG